MKKTTSPVPPAIDFPKSLLPTVDKVVAHAVKGTALPKNLSKLVEWFEDLDDPLKIKRLRQWCADVNATHSNVKFDFVYVDQDSFDQLTEDGGKLKGQLNTFADLVKFFTAYK